MSSDGSRQPRLRRWVLTGTTRVMDCCDFYWEEKEGTTERLVSVGQKHCARCVNELRGLGFQLREGTQDDEPPPFGKSA